MSKFTGKSDFCDWCEMHNSPKEIVEKAMVVKDNAILDTSSEINLIPYYTHLISSMGVSKDSQSIHLSSESFIDIEEKDTLMVYWECLSKVLRKLKMEKREFSIENIKKEGFSTDWYPEVLKPILNIIKENADILKIVFPKNKLSKEVLIKNFLIPNYFSRIHLGRFNRQREDFIKFCKEKGFKVVMDNKIEDGIYHPIIVDMCYKIEDYKKMKNQ